MCLVAVIGSLAGVSHAHGVHSDLMALVDAQLEKEPRNGELWYRRAELELEHEDYEETLRDLEKTEECAPGKFPVLWVKGQVLDAQGKPEEAKAALDTHLAANPTHWGALASRARVETKLSLHEKALLDYAAALASNREAEPDLVQETAACMAANGHTDEAVKVLENGLKRLGPIPSLQMKVLEIEVLAERFDAALVRVSTLQRLAPRPEPWMARRASILTEANRLTEARAAWLALSDHLKALPEAERGSHSMSKLAQQAREAIAALDSLSPQTSPNPFVSTKAP
ncbi:hypothetical protein [Luteolibacter sp. LG18]|uniref:tetratricopeptide repeat protein n=1 Tax=Luteolibacter sp. LG18 TaxID=2819286 RepID=UPI002B303F21|nr:hypothetical protein llg_45000 [Luteolibacter sp. LG18]